MEIKKLFFNSPFLCRRVASPLGSLNGRDLGVAFVGFDTEGLYPAASMNVGQAARFNFGYSPFLYTPIDANELPFRPITEAAAVNDAAHNSGPNVALGTSRHGCRSDMPPVRPREPLLAENRGQRVVGDRDGEQADLESRGSRGLSSRSGRDRANRSTDTSTRETRPSPHDDSIGGNRGEEVNGAEGAITHLELQRQSLVENLIGMGFPIEWAIRAAEHSGKQLIQHYIGDDVLKSTPCLG